MITAKNYAAQAERGLLDMLYYLPDTDKKAALLLIDLIRKSVHFAMPDGGKIFNDGLRGLDKTYLNLPFRHITVELFNTDDSGDDEKILIIASQVVVYGDIEIASVCHNKINGWMMEPLALVVPCDLHVVGNKFEREIQSRILSPWTLECFTQEQAFARMNYCDNVVQELMEALSCVNIEQTVFQKESAKNKQRIKSHKTPIYETKILTINARKKTGPERENEPTGTHASPRQHLRRGHIRRLESGNIWVNSCVVGSHEEGVIKKDYRVKA